MLAKIVAAKREAVARDKAKIPFAELEAGVTRGHFALQAALERQSWNIIAECKQASPAKGKLAKQPVAALAALYEQYGAAALSILTDRHFAGELDDLAKAGAVSALPLLRKDFVIDAYQLYEARCHGASAVLLIAAILQDDELRHFLAVGQELGLDCLVEVHSREELARVQQTEARLIGINNRDLRTFTTSIEQTFALLPYCDRERLLISESGIRTAADTERLQAAGLCGALIGEGLVTAVDIGAQLRCLSEIKRSVNHE